MTTTLPAARLDELRRLLAAPDSDEEALDRLDIDMAEALGDGPLTEVQARFLACFALESEVARGGLDTFLCECGLAVAYDALSFLDDQGLEDVGKILRQAIALLPEDDQAIQDIVEEQVFCREPGPLFETLTQLDEQLFTLLDPVSRARLRYAEKNSCEFFDS